MPAQGRDYRLALFLRRTTSVPVEPAASTLLAHNLQSATPSAGEQAGARHVRIEAEPQLVELMRGYENTLLQVRRATG